ncbi:MAG TPA: VOC family protein [Thermoanaerobaculia bacterium]|nr:VOC family protein [Thermoanaerobaculia bacterium]
MAKPKTRPSTRTAPKQGRRAAPKSKPTRRAAAARPPARAVERRLRKPEALRLRTFSPGFTVDDLQRSIEFYTRALGFMVSERWTSAGKLRGVMLKAGLCELGISQDDFSKGRERRKGEGVRVWCETVQDIDELAARIRAAGGKLTQEPKDQTWGVRSLSVDDPDGFHLTIYREL